MYELFNEKNRDVYLKYFKITKKSFLFDRILYSVGFVVLLCAYAISFEKTMYLVSVPFMGYIGWKFPYLIVLNKKRKVDVIKSFQFPRFLMYFDSFYDLSGNIKKTFERTLDYVDEPLKTELEKLIHRIENEGHSREAYLKFAEFVGTSEADQIMSLIYDFEVNGSNKEDLAELQIQIDDIEANKLNELVNKKIKSMDLYSNVQLVAVMIFTVDYCFELFNLAMSQGLFL